MKINRVDNYFSTTDLSLASALNLFFPLDSVDKNNPAKIVFNFIRTSDLDQIIEKFWRGELKVEPQKYFAQIKILKSRIYEH